MFVDVGGEGWGLGGIWHLVSRLTVSTVLGFCQNFAAAVASFSSDNRTQTAQIS